MNVDDAEVRRLRWHAQLLDRRQDRTALEVVEWFGAMAELLGVKRQLAGAVNNLNQLARHANTTHQVPDRIAATLVEVEQALASVDLAVKTVVG